MSDAKISALPTATTPLAGTEVLPVVQGSATKNVTVANLTAGRAVSTGALTTTGDVTTTEATTVVAHTVANTNSAGYSILNIKNTGASGREYQVGMGGNTSAQAGKWYVYDAIAAAVRFSISSGGDITVGQGNLIQGTAAKGINFTANTPAAGMTSQLLNWYEEGTWTGTFTAVTPPTTPITATGYYTRIGRKVSIQIAFTNVDTTGAVGNWSITGLPFTSANVPAIGSMMQYGLSAPGAYCAAYIATNTTEINGYSVVDNAEWTQLAITAGATKFIWLSIDYII